MNMLIKTTSMNMLIITTPMNMLISPTPITEGLTTMIIRGVAYMRTTDLHTTTTINDCLKVSIQRLRFRIGSVGRLLGAEGFEPSRLGGTGFLVQRVYHSTTRP